MEEEESYDDHFIDPAMFTKPPPNFRPNPHWNSFKIPIIPRKNKFYMNRAPGPPRNFTGTLYPNPIMKFKQESRPGNYYPDNNQMQPRFRAPRRYLRYNPMNAVQPFIPNFPPPSLSKYSNQESVDPSQSGESVPSHDEAYYNSPKFRYSPSLPSSQMTLPPSSVNFSVPPPNHHMRQSPVPYAQSPHRKVVYSLPYRAPMRSDFSSTGVPRIVLKKTFQDNYFKRNNNSPQYPFTVQPNDIKRKIESPENPIKRKKRKKPMTETKQPKKNWTFEDCKRVLEVELECHKKYKRPSLIIKFPDADVNRDIVTAFHSSIETVHFQHPSTPRYCFVTLTESADPETVIRQLNQIPFGLGYLHADIKKEKDEENLKPHDIDPLTLYVGNLAQEITKQDIVTAYPKHKRIDIGYAKKLKFTRYAFVTFSTVDDAIEAFQNTYSLELFSKSLIVRFRRLHSYNETHRLEIENSVPSVDYQDSVSSHTEENQHDQSNPWDIDVSHWESDIKSEMDSHVSEEEDQELELWPSMSYGYGSHVRSTNDSHRSYHTKRESENEFTEEEDYDVRSTASENNSEIIDDYRIVSSETIKIESPDIYVKYENSNSTSQRFYPPDFIRPANKYFNLRYEVQPNVQQVKNEKCHNSNSENLDPNDKDSLKTEKSKENNQDINERLLPALTCLNEEYAGENLTKDYFQDDSTLTRFNERNNEDSITTSHSPDNLLLTSSNEGNGSIRSKDNTISKCLNEDNIKDFTIVRSQSNSSLTCLNEGNFTTAEDIPPLTCLNDDDNMEEDLSKNISHNNSITKCSNRDNIENNLTAADEYEDVPPLTCLNDDRNEDDLSTDLPHKNSILASLHEDSLARILSRNRRPSNSSLKQLNEIKTEDNSDRSSSQGNSVLSFLKEDKNKENAGHVPSYDAPGLTCLNEENVESNLSRVGFQENPEEDSDVRERLNVIGFDSAVAAIKTECDQDEDDDDDEDDLSLQEILNRTRNKARRSNLDVG